MEKYIYATLIAFIIAGAGGAIKFYNKYQKSQADLVACKSVPDFIPALHNVKEFVGARKRFHFKVKCSNAVEFDFFDTKKCAIQIEEDISNKNISLIKEDYKGTNANSSYIAHWIEDWNFYIDLSKSEKWKIEKGSKTITFEAPQIQIARLSKSGVDNYLVYTKDKALWSNNHKALFNMTKGTDRFATIKSGNYLKDNYGSIQKEMEKSIKDFVKSLIVKLGYPEDYEVLVNFEDIKV